MHRRTACTLKLNHATTIPKARPRYRKTDTRASSHHGTLQVCCRGSCRSRLAPQTQMYNVQPGSVGNCHQPDPCVVINYSALERARPTTTVHLVVAVQTAVGAALLVRRRRGGLSDNGAESLCVSASAAPLGASGPQPANQVSLLLPILPHPPFACSAAPSSLSYPVLSSSFAPLEPVPTSAKNRHTLLFVDHWHECRRRRRPPPSQSHSSLPAVSLARLLSASPASTLLRRRAYEAPDPGPAPASLLGCLGRSAASPGLPRHLFRSLSCASWASVFYPSQPTA